SGFRQRDALMLLPSMAPLAWVAFDAVAFGDPFYTTHVASGYVDNVRFVFGWSAPVSAAQFPVRLESYLSDAMPVSLALLAIPGAAYGVWRDRRTGGHLTALLMIPALATGAVY